MDLGTHDMALLRKTGRSEEAHQFGFPELDSRPKRHADHTTASQIRQPRQPHAATIKDPC
jgi:hypothetical protein